MSLKSFKWGVCFEIIRLTKVVRNSYVMHVFLFVLFVSIVFNFVNMKPYKFLYSYHVMLNFIRWFQVEYEFIYVLHEFVGSMMFENTTDQIINNMHYNSYVECLLLMHEDNEN